MSWLAGLSARLAHMVEHLTCKNEVAGSSPTSDTPFPSYNYFNLVYISHLSYCFCTAVNRIYVAISRADGALKPWSAIHLGEGNSKPTYLDFYCSSYVKSASVVGRKKSFYGPNAMQQHVVEHEEHDKALKKSGSSTASGLSSRCLDTVLPLNPAR